MAKQQIAKKTVDTSAAVVAFAFTNGKELTAALDGLAEDVLKRLALHGLSQKLGDAYAGAESVDDAYEAAADVYETLKGGKWTERTAGEPRTSSLVEALFRVMDGAQELDACKAVVENMDDEQRKALRAQPAIKAALANIAAEKAQAKAAEKPFDPSALFAG